MEDVKHEVSTAILVDGGFYRRRAFHYAGEKEPAERADELFNFCIGLLWDKYEKRNLYRIFYYDCPPSEKVVYNPVTKRQIDLKKSPQYQWTMDFYQELRRKRKLAIRLGTLADSNLSYSLTADAFKKLMRGDLSPQELTENDIKLDIKQKGVDMRIGIDIASLAFKKQVQQIILVAGDSDFVPAAKQARREGIDFILAPMGATIRPDLFEHIDGLIGKILRLDDAQVQSNNLTDLSSTATENAG